MRPCKTTFYEWLHYPAVVIPRTAARGKRAHLSRATRNLS